MLITGVKAKPNCAAGTKSSLWHPGKRLGPEAWGGSLPSDLSPPGEGFLQTFLVCLSQLHLARARIKQLGTSAQEKYFQRYYECKQTKVMQETFREL